MKVFVARQPIFNRNRQVVAYELLYRESEENRYSAADGDKATTDLIINSFINIGIEKLTEGKRCFVNFTESLMFSDLLPPLILTSLLSKFLRTYRSLRHSSQDADS